MSLEQPMALTSADPANMTTTTATTSSAATYHPQNNKTPTSLQSAEESSEDEVVVKLPAASVSSTSLDAAGRARSPPINGEAREVSAEVDPQIMEALRGKDRLYVLKLGEQFEELISERRTRLELTPSTTYQRMLVHRCSAFHKLTVENDPASKAISVSINSETKIPTRRLADLLPAETTVQPAFKIMRRAPRDKLKATSSGGSLAGDDDGSDGDSAEAGSQGGRSSAAKKRKTIEEREAAYNEARSRIFMGFDDKGKSKESGPGSSAHSIVSSSAASSTAGDLDDALSTAPTESERSGPTVRRKDPRLRSNAQIFNTNGGTNSRGSRSGRSSPFFEPIYEQQRSSTPSSSAAPYDPAHYAAQQQQMPPPHGYIAQYMYPVYPAPLGPMPPQGYMHPYPYYPPPYGYQPPPPPPSHSDPVSPTGDPYVSMSPAAAYPGGYPWPQMPQQPQSHQPQSSQDHSSPPPLQHSYSQPYMHMHSYPYGMYQPAPGFPPAGHVPYVGYPGPPGAPPPPPAATHSFPDDLSRTANLPGNSIAGRPRGLSGSSAGSNKRGPQRAAWSYGPGESMGPRLNSNMRRISGASSSSGSRTPADEAASTASSSTSSSSRRTYTSTASSQHHPLPPRPDWAVGLKPHPTLHAPNRAHDNNSRNMSPARNGQHLALSPQHSSRSQPLPPHSADFPPLPTVPQAEKRTPVGGAWGNTSAMSSVLRSPRVNTPGNALVLRYADSPNPQGGSPSHQTPDRSFERPAPKTTTDLYDPTRPSANVSRNGSSHLSEQLEKDESEKEGADPSSAILGDKLAAVSLDAEVAQPPASSSE